MQSWRRGDYRYFLTTNQLFCFSFDIDKVHSLDVHTYIMHTKYVYRDIHTFMHTCMNSYIKTSPPIITSTTEKGENDIHSFNPDISIAPPKSTSTRRRSRPQ